MIKLIHILTISLFFSSSNFSASENTSGVAVPKLKFNQLVNKEAGVVSEFSQITKDNKGLFWFATLSSLLHYNGYEFVTYKKDVEKNNISLIDESIYSIAYNKNSGLWFGSAYSLVNLKNGDARTYLRKDSIARKYINNDALVRDSHTLPGEPVKEIFFDKNNDVWLGMAKSLALLYKGKSEIKTFSPWAKINDSELSPLQLYFTSITGISKDDKGNFWLATLNRGLIKFDRKENTAKVFNSYSNEESSILSVSSFIKKDPNNFLLATNKGLMQFNISSEKFSAFPVSSPIKEPLKAIFKQKNGDVWVGGSNLFMIDEDNVVTEYDQRIDFKISENNVNVGAIFVDEEGTVLVCFDNYGIFRANPYTSKIKLINNLKGTDNRVKDIKLDGNGGVWVGYSKGLVRGSFKLGVFEYELFKHVDGTDFTSIKQIHLGRDGDVWVAERNIITKINVNGRVESYRIGENILKGNYIYSLVEDYKGVVWFSVFKKGVFKLDPTTGLVSKEPKLLEQELHVWQFIDLITFNNRRVLTYIKSAGGFGEFDLENNKFIRVYKEKQITQPYEHPLAFRDSSAWEVRKDDLKNGFWITHAERFISFFNYQTGKGATIDTPIKEPIVGLLTDKSDLWLYGENGGVHFWDKKNSKVTSFDKKDGLPTVGVTGSSGVALANNKILLGSKEGLVLLTPNSFKLNPYLSEAILSSIRINNEKTDISKFNLGASNYLNLKYNENLLEFSFFGTSTAMPSLNKFKYRLVGLYDDWIEANEGERKVRYTNLDPGDYIFEVQSSNNDGVWGEAVSQTRIIITPPYWATPWAYLFYVLLVLFLAWFTYKMRIRAIEDSNAKLKKLVAQKTTKIASLLDFKNHFLLDLTHEFKTRLQIQQEHLNEVYTYLDKSGGYNVDSLRDSNKNMARIVDQLLQLANQQETEHYVFIEINLNTLLSLTAHLFDHLAKKLDVIIEVDVPANPLFVKAHEDSFERIFTNLIGNAIKYNKTGGRVNIKAVKKGTKVIISINDTGGGIAGHKLPKNIKYLGAVSKEQKLDHAVVSHGLGLKLVEEDVKINHGDIEVESTAGIGTTFTLSFQGISSNQQTSTQLSDNARQMIELESDGPKVKAFDITDFQNKLPSDPDRDTIVIIEDTFELLEILATHLKEHFNVVVAEDGETGLELCKTICPDIVLTDLNMPKLSGYGVIESIKQDPLLGHIPVVLLTAVANDDVKVKGLELGADDVIAKPVQQAELLKRLQNKLAARNAFWQHYTIENQLNKKLLPPNSVDGVKLTQLEQQNLHIEKWLENVHQFISENLSNRDNLKVRMLANHMGCTTSFVTAKLKSLTGIVGVKGYMRDYRLIMAHTKLTTQKVGKIEILAEEYGFSEAQFSKDYKTKYGRAPRETKTEFEAKFL